MMVKTKKLKITFLSTWPEVNDGIATFCENLAKHLPEKFSGYKIIWNIARINWIRQLKDKDTNKIVFEVNSKNLDDYIKLAKYINTSDTDIVVIQFINNIFGGFGNYIFEFLKKNQKPVLVVLHSIPMFKTQSKLQLKQKILKKFKNFDLDLVVMSNTAKKFLSSKMGFKNNSLHKIYHPAPDFVKLSEIQKNNFRKKLGFDQKTKIIFTYGILREDKGILEILQALQILIQQKYNVKFLLCGKEQDSQGKYTKKIKALVSDLNLKNHFKFVNEFLEQKRIGEYLQSSDIFLTTQHNLGLHSSGTLAYALSAGSVIISTPIIHAQEILDGAGIIVPSKNPRALSVAVKKLLDDQTFYKRCQLNSKKIGRNLSWNKLSLKYLQIFWEIVKRSKKI
ncbi:MAG: glycosyltransferase [bacterium]